MTLTGHAALNDWGKTIFYPALPSRRDAPAIETVPSCFVRPSGAYCQPSQANYFDIKI
jgi:hypothetical protein